MLFSLFIFFVFPYFSVFYIFPIPFSFPLPPIYCAQLRPFYTAYCDKIYHFYPSTTFGLLWVPFLDYPLVCWLLSHHHYSVLAAPRFILRKSSFFFVFCFPWHSHPNKGWVSLLLTLIACT